jgi:hypothetical protein
MEEVSGSKQLTFGMVTAGLKLSKLQVKNIFTTVLNKSMPVSNDSADPEDTFCLLAADALEKVAFLSPAQRTLILLELRPVLTVPCRVTVPLVFADGRYCAWEGRTGYLDLETGDQVDEIPHLPLQMIGYNLPELYRRGVWMLENRNGFHVKKSAAGSVDQ